MFNRNFGINIIDNPIADSVYFSQPQSGGANPPPPGDFFIITEDGNFILSEGNDFLITE